MPVPRQDRRRWIWAGRGVTLMILAGLGWYFSRVGWERASVIAGVVGLFAGLIALVAPYLLPAPQPPSPPPTSPAPPQGAATQAPKQAVTGSGVGGDVRQISGVVGSVRVGPAPTTTGQPPATPAPPPPPAAVPAPAPAASGSQTVDNSTVTGSVTQIGDVGGHVDIDR